MQGDQVALERDRGSGRDLPALRRAEGPFALRFADCPPSFLTVLSVSRSMRVVASPRTKQVTAALEPSRPRWEQRRDLLAQELAEHAALALTKVGESLRAGQGRDAKDFATTLGILIDKAQLLAPGGTGQGAQANGAGTIDSEIRQLMDELEAGTPDGG